MGERDPARLALKAKKLAFRQGEADFRAGRPRALESADAWRWVGYAIAWTMADDDQCRAMQLLGVSVMTDAGKRLIVAAQEAHAIASDPARLALERVLAVMREYLRPDGVGAAKAMSTIVGLVVRKQTNRSPAESALNDVRDAAGDYWEDHITAREAMSRIVRILDPWPLDTPAPGTRDPDPPQPLA